GDVVDDRALVAIRPGVPVEGQLGAGSGAGVESAGGRALVADDVVSAGRSRLDETIVLVQGGPASS
nr:hypothetical protein [Tanacetum cinerariifolium]